MLEQCCNHSKQCRNNAATLCCAKNRLCKSSLVTSPLQPAQLSPDHSFLNQHIYLKWGVFSPPLPYPSPPPHTHTQVFFVLVWVFFSAYFRTFHFCSPVKLWFITKKIATPPLPPPKAQVDKCWSVEREAAGSNRGGFKSQGR